ncbi:tyrosyl-trna synthetase [Fusarium austroafricanum]|uniref:Tyrosine--tRNA ligase n=1 Tax=Fusarium austroafricanum TaxID=2364996 RepID=A0A8H4KS20_9HYPO|nr:tyrosyl-trna synthetase [Fusarium austroafricanum]
MSSLSAEERLRLITENLTEVLNPEIIKSILDKGENPKIYWGTATTGRPHCGYLVPAIKIAQFLAAGCDVTVLLADIHAFLDNQKAPIELVENRVEYYRFVITSLLKACSVPVDKLRIVKGSSFQQQTDYFMDFLKLSTMVTDKHARKAGADVVKQSSSTPVSGLMYPLMQVLDEQHLGCDAQFGGVDQRKLFTAATEWLPKLGYRKRAHLMNPMIAGLNGNKMSSSDADSKIDLLDTPELVVKKINKAHCVDNVVDDNGLLPLVQHVLLPLAKLKTGTSMFTVPLPGGESRDYIDILKVKTDFLDGKITPQMLKAAVATGLNEIMAPIRAEYEASKEWLEVTLKAYPPPSKKEKKIKNLGTRFPGATTGDTVAVEVTKETEDS